MTKDQDSEILKNKDIYFNNKDCLIKMNDIFKKNLMQVYNNNSSWKKLRNSLKNMKNSICKEVKFILRKDKFIYFTSDTIIRKLCILYKKVEKQIYK